MEKTELSGIVNFSKQEGQISGFDIDAYTGSPVDRAWGKLIVAIDGIKAKKQMPILRNHDRNAIVGYSTAIMKDTAFRVRGVFSAATDAAKEVMALALEGFPWQASIGVRPVASMEILEGSSMMVNGQNIAGPAEVWTSSEVFETSFVPLGADGKTKAAVFADEDSTEKNRLARLDWDRDKQIQADFNGNFDAYLGYLADTPNIKIKTLTGQVELTRIPFSKEV